MSILMDVATSSKKIYEKKFKLNRQTQLLDILLILVSYMSICLILFEIQKIYEK